MMPILIVPLYSLWANVEAFWQLHMTRIDKAGYYCHTRFWWIGENTMKRALLIVESWNGYIVN